MQIWTLENYNPRIIPDWANESYQKILPYVTEFLTSKHPHRNGVMCPFVPRAIKQDALYFTFFEGAGSGDNKSLVNECIAYFKKNVGAGNGAIIIIFQDDFSIDELLSIHIENKVSCIKSFIMLGALYANNSAPSLHCDDYYPLRTPMPSLVLRNITSSDLTFLEPEHYSPITKAIFLTAFIRRFRRENASSKFAAAQVALAISARRRQLLHIACALAKLTALLAVLVTIVYLLA